MKKALIFLPIIVLLSAVLLCNSTISAAENDFPHINAPYEDSDISLWFDYATEKVSPSMTESTGMNGFTVYMAKNEIEDAQFVLLSSVDKTGLTAEITELEDAEGNTLPAEVYIELYQDCDKYGIVPDATPPLASYGAFSLTAGTSQAFLIRVKTDLESVAGDYEATLSVYDGDGREIKTAKVYAHVWSFALSEETACGTSMNLERGRIGGQAKLMQTTEDQMYINYYDFLLENRICSYYLPYNVYSSQAVAYMDNPRVTAYQMTNKTGGALTAATVKAMFATGAYSGENGQARFEKSYIFSGIVDAYRADQLEAFREYYNTTLETYSTVKCSYTDVPFNLINTYINDIDYVTGEGTTIDQVEYYSDFLRFWCSKPFAYTDKSELSVFGAKLMQPQKWDSVYGTFGERMAEKRAEGQKVWWFLSWDVDAPYINYYIQTDGVAHRILFWQQYDNGVQGFLTNFSNYWVGDPYTYNITNDTKPNAHGESAFIYPGSTYGLTVPVGSLRLEAMRDGIEDYQMFYQLEQLSGDGAADALIDKMTTGMVHYSTSDSDYYETRIALGEALERATVIAQCDHHFVTESSTPSTCKTQGEASRRCDICGYSYTETLPLAEHKYEEGTCTECGEADPDWNPVITGDINEDGKVSSLDTNMMMKIITGTLTPSDNQRKAADIDGSDKIDAKDSQLLQKMLTGVN